MTGATDGERSHELQKSFEVVDDFYLDPVTVRERALRSVRQESGAPGIQGAW